MKQIKTIKELKEEINNDKNEFFILLNGGLRSSKTIFWEETTKKFLITNEIDDSEQELSEKELMDKDITNIGYAMKKGAFYAY